MKKIYKEEEINVDVETIFNLINEVENYPDFLPWCTKTEVTKESENINTGKIFISKSFINWNFSTINIIDVNKSITLSLQDDLLMSLMDNGLLELLTVIIHT